MSPKSHLSPFASLDSFVALPRVESLALTPDGSRVILTVATLNADKSGYERALWSVPAQGAGTPTRLTRSAKGESGVAFTGSGDILFVSARPDASDTAAAETAQLWMLPAAGGDARAITRLPGGISGVAASARDRDQVVISAGLLPNSASVEADGALRARRKTGAVSAILHESYPIRFWDHDLGPDEPHLLSLNLDQLIDTVAHPAPASSDTTDENASTDSADGANGTDGAAYPAHLPRPSDLTPNPGRTADTAGQALTPDGHTLYVALREPGQRSGRMVLTAIDVATGAHTTLMREHDVDFSSPVLSRDGKQLAYVRTPISTPAGPHQQEIWVTNLDAGTRRRIAAEWDRWPSSIHFDHTGTALIVTADNNGRGPLFRLPLDGGAVEQITHDDFSYADVSVDEHSGDLFALRSSWRTPAHPVRITPAGLVTELATPAPLPVAPGSITEVETTAEDGARVRAWLLLPDGASAEDPAPLLLWIHGGPLNSWNAWSWRWTPLTAVARGYAVLLPDPALSTGYGLDFIARGWNSWGDKPYTDLLAITDATEARPDIRSEGTAAMGGSFGGYMANWIAGHTDRFSAIVTHASLWALDQFNGTTDNSEYWQSIFTPQAMVDNSPHLSVANISTPMLVVHGDRDYRVPIGEGLRLWSELAEHHAAADGSTVHKFLYFPDENHWILKPQNSVVWYETVFAFLDQHVHGTDWNRPTLLG